MQTLPDLLKEATGPEQFAEAYFGYLNELLNRLDKAAIAGLMQELELARQNGNTVFIVGNGGSASTASHMANDLGLGTATGEGTPFRVLSLTDNVAVMTAIANDEGYDRLFVSQLVIHYRPGDKLLVISGSGNSPNVVAAAEWVKNKGGTVIGLTGFDGGKVKDLCDIVINVETPVGQHECYGPIEDIHMILDHLVTTWLRWRLESGAVQ